MTYEPCFVGLDVGATTMKAAVVNDSGRPLSLPLSAKTEPAKGQDHGLRTMASAIRRAIVAAGLSVDRLSAIGIATPGTMDIGAGMMIEPPNMKPWRNVPVRQFIEDEFNLPTAFQNDANAAALGEYWVGAGRGVRSFALFTLGTGIGGGIVLAGKVIEGEHSHGAELGHIKIEMTNGRQCGCGQRGCLEAYASATAVVARSRELLEETGQPSRLRDVADLSAKAVFQAAAAGDALAEQIVEDTARYLAIGAATVMHVIDPEVIAFGGGMAEAGEAFLDRIRSHVHSVAFPIPAQKCRILKAQLGSDAGVIGAAGCARQLWLNR